ncbi:MAG: thiol:disulfide interchange protein [Candidatus Omnitrophica bacterium]|nr:thiol:disulfide interchange protein [Candidatus Omnitrophota bacterium]MCM8793027.1 thiol:disulfide interchange protein [Candidatus Omnitrophota bacterium]
MEILNNFEVYLSKVSLLTYLLAFVGGILASFTPCVYPLLPVTIGYIGSRSIGDKRKGFFLSLAYVSGFAMVYALLGTLAALTGKVLGELTLHPLSYFLVGNLCLIFSLSLFEVFTLPLPRFLKERNPLPYKRSFLGAVLVGMLSALIISPCTAPILGAILLFVALKKKIFLGMSLLFVFAYGMGLLLILAGTFSGILANLPRTGSWMIKIKRFFAWFLLLISGYYFLKAGRIF